MDLTKIIEGSVSGKIFSDTNPDGSSKSSLTCIECPEGHQYKGEGWECATCEHYAKDYDLTAGKCKCRAADGFTEAGESCVSTEDYDALAREVRNGQISYS